MVFGKKAGFGNTAKTQAELVEQHSTTGPTMVEENLHHLPGLQYILEMSENQLIDFFTLVLKSRTNIRELDFSLGSYEYKEVQARLSTDKLHEKSFEAIAETITLSLQQDPHVVGLRLILTEVNNTTVSTIKLKVAEKEPNGPYLENGKLVDGDEEFEPSLKVIYVPNR